MLPILFARITASDFYKLYSFGLWDIMFLEHCLCALTEFMGGKIGSVRGERRRWSWALIKEDNEALGKFGKRKMSNLNGQRFNSTQVFRKAPERSGPSYLDSGFTLMELFVVISIVGLLASIAVPNLRGWNLRQKQAEAQKYLQAIHLHKMGNYEATGSYVCDLDCFCGWRPVGKTHYRYYCDDTNANTAASRTSSALGVKSSLPTSALRDTGSSCDSIVALLTGLDHSYSTLACGNLDSDTQLDIWLIRVRDMTQESTTEAGAFVEVVQCADDTNGGAETCSSLLAAQ